MDKDRLEATVGISRKWDAREAGRDVARNTIQKLSRPPSFFLLFSTIHYEKHGGFQEFLKGVWDVLPEGTPLVGGTVSGFMNNDGCYTRGATALAVSYPDMDVAVGVGHNTKRNPKKATRKCANEIKNKLKNSKYSNEILYGIISDGMVPDFPLIGRKRVIMYKRIGKLISKLLMTTTYLLNKTTKYGVGREVEVLNELSRMLPTYRIIGVSSYDDNKSLANFQFLNNRVLTNSVCGLGIKTDLVFQLKTTFGLTPTDTEIKIGKKSLFDCAFSKINGGSASKNLLKALKWPEDFFDEDMYKRTYYYPLCYEENNVIHPIVVGLIVQDSIVCTYKISGDKLVVYRASGQSLINSVIENLENIDIKSKEDILFGFIVSCTARLETLGAHIYDNRSILLDFFKEKPFLLLYGAGEWVYTPETKANYFNESFNTCIATRQ